MTTVAASRTAMASDTKVVTGDTFFHGAKITVIRGALVGCAGDNKHIRPFLKWYRGGCKGTPPEVTGDDNFEVLILNKAGLWRCDSGYVIDKIDDPFAAIGTGAGPALAMLHEGKTIEEAVDRACDVDNNSGRPVQVFELADVRKRRR